MKTYEIRTINDLLRVPAEKRDACLRQIQYALVLHELAFGKDSQKVGLDVITWADDADRTVRLLDDNENEIVTLRITDAVDSSTDPSAPSPL